ncbi:MAG: coenzyme F420-reducing hydrogenase, FrhD protein [Candidatus Thermoplasmatota archaeon]|nr:coenzyme F420-reducing hydrogenase, FrhD protein [Candidatus Thermoplasmatota archaeon]
METEPEWYGKRVFVLGCGNILFGDDGFGPAVIDHLKADFEIPEDVYAEDMGTGVRDLLFTVLLGEKKPERIIVVDSMDVGREPGEVFRTEAEYLPVEKTDDFSMHQVPTSNLLKELKEHAGVDVVLVSCQVESIPKEISAGLSEPVKRAVPRAAEEVMRAIRGENHSTKYHS